MSSWFSQVTKTALLAIFISVFSAMSPSSLLEAAEASTPESCRKTTSGVIDYFQSTSGIRIQPLHGKAFYTDLRRGIDATYVGYKITNTAASTVKDLWLEIGNFAASESDPLMALTNPGDRYQPVGDLAKDASKTIFILVKAFAVTTTTQSHDIKIHVGFPSGVSTITSECRYSFSRIFKTLAASANKVTSISVNTTTPRLGAQITATINGATGQAGLGSDPDFSVMWLSGASSSSWPTRALRLEATSITLKFKKNDPSNQ